MDLTWKLIRVSFWTALAAFVLAGIVGLLEDPLGWSDDPRWITYALGCCASFAGIVASVIAKIMASARKTPSRVPVLLMIATILVGFFTIAFLALINLGPMGVV